LPAWDRSKGRPEPIRALNRIIEQESGEPLVNIFEHAPLLRPGRPQAIPYARKRVAEMVQQAAKNLPEGMHLSLIEAWRPIERQQRIWDFMWRCAQDAFPHRDRIALRRTVCRWVAPTDQAAPPGHCTGAAVDVQLVDDVGEPIDVCAPFTRYQAAPTHTHGLTDEALHNRMILVEAMLGAGFSNCRDEWWHYSYGDAGWAVRAGQPASFYGLARLDPELYADLELVSEESFKDRPNPFFS
jgi:zinc D-Ala-D-Ala dipeptidase